MEYTSAYESPLGGITMASDGISLTGLWFQDQKYFARTLDPDHEEKNLPVFDQTRAWLDIYFRGEEPGFLPLLCLKGTPFRQQVWDILLAVPYGQVITYKEIAARMARRLDREHMSAQAVGGAVGHNPVSILVPCHRVIGSDKSLTGYAGGVDKKQRLLDLEGVKL